MYRSILLSAGIWFGVLSLYAQRDSSWMVKPAFSVNAFVDAYYCYDFNQPTDKGRQPFLFNHNRHNQFSINMALLRLKLEHKRYRAAIGIQAGTYSIDNYAAEPSGFRSIYEANAGIALTKNGKWWVDLGIFESHIGFESAIAIQNWNLTRSLLAENSPYYLSGAKLSYTPSETLELSVLACNGWQRIERISGNSMPSFGTQFTWSPSSDFSFNWSTFIGTDSPDSLRTMRYFNNLYAMWQVSEKTGLILGFDAGVQQSAKHSTAYHAWYTPVAIVRYAFSNQWKAALRAEYYSDKQGVVTTTASGLGLRTFGGSVNVDYSPVEQVGFRIEARYLYGEDPIFLNGNQFVNSNLFVTTALQVRL